MAFETKEFDAIWLKLQDDFYEIIQMPVNVIDQRIHLSGAYDKLWKSGKLLFARSIYLQGLFFQDSSELPDRMKEAEPWLRKLHLFAEREGIAVVELTFSNIRHMPGIFSIVFGAETPEQVRENIAMLSIPELGESTIQEIREVFADIPEYVVTPHLWRK